ncbi:hypothetical protein DYB32_000539 [Aphanomyces invadans]|uniref:Protein kinase domain-containing protein n=1 Tax=Aphanomyces invadans TaxID=157072 RepID=A0A3R6Z5U8_9STRA|nr:hypothetical protein DYB32_000539 [Aphanomyces invadans]
MNARLHKRHHDLRREAVFNNMVIAVKQLLPSQCGSLLIVSDFMREIRLAATLEHPNIVGFVGLAWTEGSSLADLSLLTEFMPNGKLDRVHHNMAVIHRDLKSKNILLSRTWNARLNDFGYSRVTSQDDLMTMNVGTIAWIAPEVLTGGRYTEQADIYSFGVLLSELDSLQPPYTDLTRDYIEEHHSELSNDLHHPKVKAKAKNLSNAFIAMSVAEGKLAPTFTNFIPHELLVLARECLSHAPQNRPTAIELSFRLRSFIVGD